MIGSREGAIDVRFIMFEYFSVSRQQQEKGNQQEQI